MLHTNILIYYHLFFNTVKTSLLEYPSAMERKISSSREDSGGAGMGFSLPFTFPAGKLTEGWTDFALKGGN